MYCIGNDIVDTAISGVKHKEPRFLQRVFTEEERAMIESARQPVMILWCLWAGKESAFKIISKLCGPPVFAHRRFKHNAFDFSTGDDAEITAKGQIVYENYVIDLVYEANSAVIHAVGKLHDDQSDQDYTIYSDYSDIQCLPDIRQNSFTEAEQESIRFPEAASVRTRCKKAVAQTTGLALKQLQILRPSMQSTSYPPYLLVDDKPCAIDISLAHHGNWIAWAYSIPDDDFTSGSVKKNGDAF